MRRLLAGAICVLALTGCSGKLSPSESLKDQTAQLLDAANASNVMGVHSAAAALRTTIQDQVSSGDLTAAQADTLRALISRIESEADLLGQPSPTATPTVSPTPSPTASPTASPTPFVSPTPSPTPTVEPTTAPPSETRPTDPPSIGIGLGEPSPGSS